MKKKGKTVLWVLILLIIAISVVVYVLYIFSPSVLFITTPGEEYLLKGVVDINGYKVRYHNINSEDSIDFSKYKCILASPIAADIIDNDKTDFFPDNSPVRASFSREMKNETVFDIQFVKNDSNMWNAYTNISDAVLLYDKSSSKESNIAVRAPSELKKRDFDSSISNIEITSITTYLTENQIFTLLVLSPEKVVNLLRADHEWMVVVPMWYLKGIESFNIYGWVGEDFDNMINLLTTSYNPNLRASGLTINTPYSFFVKQKSIISFN